LGWAPGRLEAPGRLTCFPLVSHRCNQDQGFGRSERSNPLIPQVPDEVGPDLLPDSLTSRF
jgi:hypothetical protein